MALDVAQLCARGFCVVAEDADFARARAAATEAARAFFALPARVKRAATKSATRGYAAPRSENYAALGGVAGRPNDDVEKVRLGAWLPRAAARF